MKKLLLLMAISAVSFLSQAQTSYTAERIIAKQSLYVRNGWIDEFKRDTSAMNADNVALTANAVRRFVEGRLAANPVKPFVDSIYKRNDSSFYKIAGQEIFISKTVDWATLFGKPSEFVPNATSNYYLQNQYTAAQAASAFIGGRFRVNKTSSDVSESAFTLGLADNITSIDNYLQIDRAHSGQSGATLFTTRNVSRSDANPHWFNGLLPVFGSGSG
ncbi:MAG TPA: hypothetical protein VD794_03075, partial [Flavisolibacter sp.]|nr:hypothetical protein [Flavisolibacter sp.]